MRRLAEQEHKGFSVSGRVRGRLHTARTAGTHTAGGRECTHHVHTTPDLVRASENWAPHSIWQTPCPFSLSMFWGTLQPSLPPRPSFPKSPSPQENTKPGKEKTSQPGVTESRPGGQGLPTSPCRDRVGMGSPSSVRARVWASLLPQATWTTLCPRRTFTYPTTNQDRVRRGH